MEHGIAFARTGNFEQQNREWIGSIGVEALRTRKSGLDPVFSPREIDNASLRLLLAIARIADEAEQLAAPQIHGTELGPKSTHIAKP